jgi:hypothetical protein
MPGLGGVLVATKTLSVFPAAARSRRTWAMSFSLRPFIEYFALFAILLLWLLDRVRYKLPLMAVSLLLVLLCQIQTYQYRYFIIHWSEMNQQKYFESLEHIFKA